MRWTPVKIGVIYEYEKYQFNIEQPLYTYGYQLPMVILMVQADYKALPTSRSTSAAE